MPLPFAPLGSNRNRGTPAPRMPFSPPSYRDPASSQGAIAAGVRASFVEDAAKAEAKRDQIAIQNESLAQRERAAQQRQVDQAARTQETEAKRVAAEAAKTKRADDNRELARAEFQAAALPPVMTPLQRADLEAEHTKKDKALRARAAARLQETLLTDPEANATTGGFLGMGGEPTPRAAEIAQRLTTLADPANLNDSDLEEFRKIEPTAFDERDTLKKRLEADSVAQTQRDTVTRSVARAKALKAGVPESELDTLVPPTGALPGADPWQRVAQAGALERDNAQVAQLAQGIEAGKTELADIDAQIEGITAEASKGGSATQVMQSQEAKMQLRQQRDQKAQALQATIERHNSQLTAIEAKSRALNEQAEAAKAPVADEAPKPAVPLASAKAAAKLEADGSYSTSQIDNLQSLASAGVKAYWADPQTTTKATPESREAKTKAVNDSIDTVQKLGADLTASAQEIQRRIENEVRSGRLAPEAAQREQEKAFAEYEKSHEEQIVARGEYLHSALRDFSEGQIDADTLNAVYHAAGGSQTGVEAFAELQTQLKKDAEHVDALTAVILGEDGKGSADPGLNGQLLGLAATAAEGSAKYAQWLNAGDYPQGMSQGEITASESNAQAGAEDAKKAKAEMERLRTEQHNKLAAELVKRGADAGQIPGLIAQAELQSLAKARPGIASVVASRGGITAFTAEKLPFVGGLVEAARILPYAETALKLENGEAVTPEEMQALGEFVRFTQEKPSFMASVTDGVASLPGFAIELYSTAGIAGAVRKGGNKAIKKVLERVATKQGRARLAAQMAKSSADNVVAAWSKNNAKKAFGVKLLRGLAEEAVRLPVASAGRIVSKYTQDLATEGVNVTNEDGHMAAVIDSDQRSKPLLRVANAVIDSYIENVSERSGFLLGKIPGGKFLASKLSALSKAAKSKLVSVAMFKAFVRANPGAAPGKIAKILKGANIGSVPEEMFEERLGSAARDVWNGLSGKGWESTVIPSPEDFGVEFLTFLVPGAHAAIQTQRHFGKLDRAITASDSEATSHMDGFASDPAAHAQRLSQLVGAPISADDITRATDLTGPVHQSDAVRTNDRMQIDLMTRSEEALNQGQIEKASNLRQMALDQSRQKSGSADGELLQGISAAGEIDGLHAAAEEIRTQASQLPDQQQQAAAMLRADDMELMGDRISALVKVATGREAVLTQNEKEALNHPSMKPAVVEENGALIITDEARDQMEQFAPTAAKYVKQSETMRREQLGQTAVTPVTTPEQTAATTAPVETAVTPAVTATPAAEPQWTATGDKGTVVSIPAGEAKTRAQAEAKLVSKLPKGENLRGGTLQKPKDPKPTPEATAAAPEPAPVDYGTGETFDSGKFADVAKARAAKLKNPKAKAHYERVVDAIAKAVKSRGKAFPNGVKLDYTMKDGGGAMLKGGALVVNPDLIGTQTTELSDDELNAWVSAVSSEEFIHLAQVQSLTTKQAEQRWNKLGSTKAGKKLQATSKRAYFAAYEARGEKPPAQTAANAYFELTRQIIQGKIDANLVTETMIGDKTFAAELLDFLKSIADYLNKALAKLPKADRADIEADIAKISATMAKLEGSLTTNETAPTNPTTTPEDATKAATETTSESGNAKVGGDKVSSKAGTLTIVRLKGGRLAFVRESELAGNGDTLREFDPATLKPVKGDKGAIARADIDLQASATAQTDRGNAGNPIGALKEALRDRLTVVDENDEIDRAATREAVKKRAESLGMSQSEFDQYHAGKSTKAKQDFYNSLKDGDVIEWIDGNGNPARAEVRVFLDGSKTVRNTTEGSPAEDYVYGPLTNTFLQAAESLKVTSRNGSASSSAETTPVDAAAQEAATSPTNAKPEPTEAQKKAGNYEMGHLTLGGMDISIENPAGSVRSGKDKDGETWQVTMASHYGYVKGSEGKDGDHIDIFITPGTPANYSGQVFVVNQMNDKGEFDEHKAVTGVGINSFDDARAEYLKNYSPGWKGDGSIAMLPQASFAKWVTERKRNGEAKSPFMQESPHKPKATKTPTPKASNQTPSSAEAPQDKAETSAEYRDAQDKARKALEGLFAPARTANDADYLAAVEAGDMATAQRIVDEVRFGDKTDTIKENSIARILDALSLKPGDELVIVGKPPDDGKFTGFAAFRYKQVSNVLVGQSLGSVKPGAGTEALARAAKVAISRDSTLAISPTIESEGFYLKLGGTFGSVAEYPSRIGFSGKALEALARKSADPVTYDESGNVIPLSQRFDAGSDSILYAPARSSAKITHTYADYLAAVEAGDSGSDNLIQLLRDAPESNRRVVVDAWLRRNPKAAANMQRLVDEAAKAAGYNVGPLLHGTKSKFTAFDKRKVKDRFTLSLGFHFTSKLGEAVVYATDLSRAETFMRKGGDIPLSGDEAIIRAFIKTDDPLVRETGMLAASMDADLNVSEIRGTLKWAEELGSPYDSVIINRVQGDEWDHQNVIVFDPNQIKSADPVTYDDQGNVIPLSQRFDAGSDSILYAPARSSAKITHTFDDGYALTGAGLHEISAPVRAFHGTPHKVDKLRMSKVGTGEGAQAYGWGLYFAAKQEVAAWYKENLAMSAVKPLEQATSPQEVNEALRADFEKAFKGKWRDRAIDHLAFEIRQIESRYGSGIEPPKKLSERLSLYKASVEDLVNSRKVKKNAGNLYTVELLPDESEFLDWDKPISEQSNPKLAALRKAHRAFLADPAQRISDKGKNGDSLYHMLVRQKGSAKAASEYLASIGIPGIKYLDGNSRDNGKGTRNYVIFDENLVRILEENGKPVDPILSPARASTNIEQLAVPENRTDAIIQTARSIIAAKIRTPEGLAAFLEDTFAGKARGYSEAIWDAIGMVDKTLRGTHDWNAIYAGIDSPQEAPTETPQAIAEMVRDALLEGREVNVGEMENSKQRDETIELGITMAARAIVERGQSEAETLAALIDLYSRQPKLTAKTSTSKINQAYSTPAPMAYFASRLADVAGGRVIMESTAGNGMLLIERQPGQAVLANELDPKRRERLAIQGINASGEDATKWTPSQSPDRVIINPPFGQVMDDNGNNIKFQTPAGETTSIDHAIMLQALNVMQPDGRAVFLIGGPPPTVRSAKARKEYYRSGKKGDFFTHLYQNYRVIDHFTVSGDLYAKQGAGWPIDIIVVDGKGRSPIALPGMKSPRIMSTWEELANDIQRTDAERIEAGKITEAEVRADAGEMVSALTEAGSSGLATVASTVGGNVATPADAATNTESNGSVRPQSTDAGRTSPGDRKGSGERIESGPTEISSTNAPGALTAIQERGNGVAARDSENRAVETQFQTAYSPVAVGVPSFELLAPVNLEGPMRKALESLRDKVGDLTSYVSAKLGYPDGTDLGKHFAAEQIDALAQAIYNVENGGALVIGDQTGVGKGRVVAGLMKYAVKNNMTPVFFTKDPTLYDAMLDDLVDIGAPEIHPLITNNAFDKEYADFKERLKKAGIPYGKEHFTQYLESGNLPKRVNAIFTSYTQISSDDAPGLTTAERAQAKRNEEAPPDAHRMATLRKLAPNSLMILDESHLAAGASTTGWRLGELLSLAKQVYYSSATFAKRPDNMGLYFRTNLGGLTGDMSELIDLMRKGGVPAMQIASSMLAEDGQYMRRERSFAGVSFATSIMSESYERDKDLADNYTDGLRTIVGIQDRMARAAEAVNAMVAAAGKRWDVPGKNRVRLESQNFSAKLHNMVRQYLLAIKANAAADQAIIAIRDGVKDSKGVKRSHKVIVAVENTMESVIDSLQGSGLPLTFNGMLRMYLDQQREIVVRAGGYGKAKESYILPREGNPEFKSTDMAGLQRMLVGRSIDEETGESIIVINQDVLREVMWRAMNGVFLEAEAAIESVKLADMPVSPIDAMRQRVEAAGIRTGEMTARTLGIDSEGNAYARNEGGKAKAMSEFNNGDLHFLVINRSGSTGVSMHASQKFKDKRPRLMMVVQPNLDINEFMQTIGRIHRSGQVELPSYVMLQTALPAEKRPAAILGSKMSMLNANTTSNADSEVSQGDSIDLFNKYGDEVTHNYLRANPRIVTMINMSWDGKLSGSDGNLLPLSDFQNSENGGEGYLSRSVTGHLAILPVEEQEAFWEAVETDYKALIAYLDQIGQNDLRAKVIDLKAKTVKSEQFTTAIPGTESRFAAPSFLETVETSLGRKPMTAEEATIKAGEVRQQAATQLSEYLAASNAFIDSEDERKAVVQNKWEEKRDDWRANQQASRDTIANAINQIGAFGVFTRPDGTQGWGMVESVKINAAKPNTPSAHTARILVNDSNYRLDIPLSKIGDFIEYRTYGERDGWSATYDFGSTRTVVTGNLLAAIPELNNAGQIISYTTADGENKMGILLPASFTKDRAAAESNRMPVANGQAALERINGGMTVVNSVESLRIYPGDSGVHYISVPATRAGGGKYWRDPTLNRFLVNGEFSQSNDAMYGEIQDGRTVAVINHLLRSEPLFSRQAGGQINAPRLGIDDPEFAAALAEIEATLPSPAELAALHERAGIDWGASPTGDELAQLAQNRRWSSRAAYDEQREREQHDDWNEEARVIVDYNEKGAIRELASIASQGIGMTAVQTKTAQILLPRLTVRSIMNGDKQAFADAGTLTWGYDIAGTETARGLAARHQPHLSPEETHREFLAKAMFTPDRLTRERIRQAPSPDEKAERIAELEAELEQTRKDAVARERDMLSQMSAISNKMAEGKQAAMQKAKAALQSARAQAKADIAKLTDDLANVRKEKDKFQLLAEANEARLEEIRTAFADMGVTLEQVLITKEAKLAIQGTNVVKGVFAQFTERERKAVKHRLDGFSNRQIAKYTGISLSGLDAIFGKFDAALMSKFEAMAAQGITVEDFEAMDAAGNRIDIDKLIDKDGNLLAPARPTPTPEEIKTRAMAMFRAIMPSDEARKSGALKRTKGEQPGTEAPYGFDLSRPEHAAMLVRAINRLDSNGMDMVYEFWINGLLSGPSTQVANIAGNTGAALLEYGIQRPIAALVNATLFRDAAGPSLGEFQSMARYAGSAAATAFRFAKIAWQTEVTLFDSQWLNKPITVQGTSERGQIERFALPGKFGRVVRIPTRLLGMADEFAKHLIGQLEAAAQAHRIAKAEGLTGEAFDTRVDQLVRIPGSAAWIAAVEQAHKLTFTEELPDTMQKMQNVLHSKAKTPMGAVIKTLLRFIFPFVRTPYNIFKTGLRKTPLGSARMVGKGLAAWRGGRPFFDSYPKAAIATDLAEQLIGYMVTWLLIGAGEGDPDDDKKLLLLTGTRSRNDNIGEDQLLRRTRGGETSILWKGKPIFNYGRYEPFATVVATIVDAGREMKRVKGGTPVATAMKSAVFDVIDQARSKTFLQGFEGLMSLMDERSGKNPVDSAIKFVAQGVVPNLIRQPLRNVDNYARDTRNAPWYYSALPFGSLAEPLYDLYGRPVQKGGSPVSRLFMAEPDKQLPIETADKAMRAFAANHPLEAKFLSNPTRAAFRYKDAFGKFKDMTPQEAALYRKTAGQRFKVESAGVLPAPLAPTPEDMTQLGNAKEKAFRDVKSEMFTGGVAPVIPPRKAPSLSEIFGQRLRQ